MKIQDFRLFLEGTNTRANKILNIWDSVISPVREGVWAFADGQMTPEVFCAKMQNLNTYIQTRLPQSSDQRFNKFMKQTALADRDYLALIYLIGPEGSRLKTTGYPRLYDEILRPGEPEKCNYLAQSYGNELLELYCRFYCIHNSGYTPEDVLPLFSTDLYKGEILLLFLNRFYSPDDCRDLLIKYGRYIISDDQQKRVDVVLQKLAPYARGNKAFDFTFEDQENKMVSLSDFQGKLVLVDVWATTCRPCVAEIPFLKKVEEHFSGKEIVFIGISTDRLKDRNIWEKFVTEQNLPGIQLFAGGFENSLVKDYQISSIPRFMLFDREGKIITVDAPLPSNPELSRLIEQYF